MAELVLSEIFKAYGATPILEGFSATIRSGQFVSLLGPSGCGKTTVLRIVAGLEAVTGGRVEIDGEDVTRLPPERRDIAMMFQSYALLPHLSAAENVRFPLRMRSIAGREEQRQRVREALDTVRLGPLADRKPSQLSGGQQQRVALARAVVSKPKVLLLDEPLSNLDARLREDMQVELVEIHKTLGLTTLFVTHDQEEALSLSDRVILLNQGKIEQEGAPKAIYSAPQTRFASSFLGAANLLPGTIETAGLVRLEDGQSIALPSTVNARGPVTLMIRQEDVEVIPEGTEGLVAQVRARIYLGARSRHIVSLAGTEVRALGAGDRDFPAGSRVSLRISPDRIQILAATSVEN